MDLERFAIKMFTRPGAEAVDEAIFIDIFHEWIRHKTLDGILLDVADYRHVPDGPGIMLISHEINFAMDHANGRFGLYAQRKLGEAATHRDRILELVRATVAFGALLELDHRVGQQLRFEAGLLEYSANDRLLAPNTEAAYASLKPDLEWTAAVLYPDREVTIRRVDNDPRERLAAIIDAGPVDLSVLADTVGVVG